MNKKLRISAPGKLMLFGEHAVVDGHPCIVTAVDQRLFATIELISENELQLEAPEARLIGYKKPLSEVGTGEIAKGAKFVEMTIKNMMDEMLKRVQHDNMKGFRITTQSSFSGTLGFGSSSAVTVCVIKGLSDLYELSLSKKEMFDLAYKTVLDVQGKGSGFDVAAAIYGGTLYFLTDGEQIEPLQLSELPLVVGYSGVKADTVTLMQQVKEKFATKAEELNQIYAAIENIVIRAKKAVLENDWQTVGLLMNENQALLVDLGVSTPKLDNMISAAKTAGSFGAKLSGAGGGDCMIAFVSEEKRAGVEEAIEKAGGKVLRVKGNAEGVKVE